MIRVVSADKKRYLPLLFPKDGQEGMIARYLNHFCTRGKGRGLFDTSGTALRLFGGGEPFFWHLAKLGCKNIIYFTNFIPFCVII